MRFGISDSVECSYSVSEIMWFVLWGFSFTSYVDFHLLLLTSCEKFVPFHF